MPNLEIPENLEHDCDNCQGLCCVVLQHNRGDGFPIRRNKPMNTPCRHLEMDPASQTELYKCRIHAELEDKRWHTCDNFTCFGAGQTVSRFFEELGVSWALKPSSGDNPKYQLMIKNLYAAYLILDAVFHYLNNLKHERGPLRNQNYRAAREAATKVAEKLAKVIQSTDEVLDHYYWCEYEFKPPIVDALNQVRNSSVVPASRLSVESIR